MIISDEQARLAAQQLRTPLATADGRPSSNVPQEVLAQAVEIASKAPDVRIERVAEARERLVGELGGDEIASKMLSRIVSDALR